MKTLSFDEAARSFSQLFQLAAEGETIVIERRNQRVALHSLAASSEPELAPPGYFLGDYSFEEASELNALASQVPAELVP